MSDIFAQKGWICPKCGRVLAPSTMYCLWCCSDMKESITTTGTTIPKWDTTPIKTAEPQMRDATAEERQSVRNYIENNLRIEDEPTPHDDVINNDYLERIKAHDPHKDW